MILVDTSAWIEFFRGRRRADFSAATADDEVVTCLPVLQEVLQGFDDYDAFTLAVKAFQRIRILEDPLGRDVFEEAVAIFRSARKSGITVRSSVDCLIAACALRHDAVVLHVDRDFSNLARVTKLQERRLSV